MLLPKMTAKKIETKCGSRDRVSFKDIRIPCMPHSGVFTLLGKKRLTVNNKFDLNLVCLLNLKSLKSRNYYFSLKHLLINSDRTFKLLSNLFCFCIAMISAYDMSWWRREAEHKKRWWYPLLFLSIFMPAPASRHDAAQKMTTS